jgi:uncharacterized membrane protein YjjB (DUF3815 family)
VALFAGLLAVLLHLSGGKTWSVILATVIGACFGVVVERWKKK